MLSLTDVFYFVQVVNHGGYTAAGRIMRVSKSTLSLRVQQLEADLGVQLLRRNSRKLGLTIVGSEFYQHAQTLLRAAEAAENIGRQRQSEPNGVIRITSSVTVAQYALQDILPAFMRLYPKVGIEQHATDLMTDLVGEGFDLAIRAHSSPLPDSSLVQRTLAAVPWWMFASAGYLESRGIPHHAEDFRIHDAIALARSPQTWSLQLEDEPAYVVPIAPRFVSNDMVALKRAAVAGLGIVALPGYVCRGEVATGTLVRVPRWRAADSFLTALIPDRQSWLPSVRTFLDFLVEEMPRAVADDADGTVVTTRA